MGMENWTLQHVGLSVKNMEEAVIYYKSLGGTADDSPGHILDSSSFENFKTYGKTDAPPWKIKIKMLQLGPLIPGQSSVTELHAPAGEVCPGSKYGPSKIEDFDFDCMPIEEAVLIHINDATLEAGLEPIKA